MSRSSAGELSSSSGASGLGDGLALWWGFGFRVSGLMSRSSAGELSSSLVCLGVTQANIVSRSSAAELVVWE